MGSRFFPDGLRGRTWAIVLLLALFAALLLSAANTYFRFFGNGNPDSKPPEVPPLDGPIVVAINSWPGVAAGVIANGGFLSESYGPSIFKDRYNLDVRFDVMKITDENRASFLAGHSQMMWNTVDTFAQEYASGKFEDAPTVALLFNDWSIGGDGVLSTTEVGGIDSTLLGKRIVAPYFTPPHYFFIHQINKSPNLTLRQMKDIKDQVEDVKSATAAANMFASGEADVAITWEPDMSMALRRRNASLQDAKKLTTTAAASGLIADLLVVRKDFLESNRDRTRDFLAGWFEGVKMFYEDPKRSFQILEQAYTDVEADELKRILEDDIRLTGYKDNLDFFGAGSNVARYDRLFSEAFRYWREEGVTGGPRELDAAQTRDESLLEELKYEYLESRFIYRIPEPTERSVVGEDLPVVPLVIEWQLNRWDISEEHFSELDAFYDQYATVYDSRRIAIVGHTDDIGEPEDNKELSYRRALAVRNYFVNKKGEDPDRYDVEGLGEEQPRVPNTSEENRAQNRRTEFRILPEPWTEMP